MAIENGSGGGRPITRADVVRRARLGGPRERVRFRAVRSALLDGEPAARVAAELGKSEQSVAGWVDYARRRGLDGLQGPKQLGRPRTLSWGDVDRIIAHFRRGESARAITRSTGLGRSTVTRLIDTLGLEQRDEACMPGRLSKLAARTRAIFGLFVSQDALATLVLAGDGSFDPPPPLRRKVTARREHSRAERVLRELAPKVGKAATEHSQAVFNRMVTLPEQDLIRGRQMHAIIAFPDSKMPDGLVDPSGRRGAHLARAAEWTAFTSRVLRALNRQNDDLAHTMSVEISSFDKASRGEKTVLALAVTGLLGDDDT